VIVLAPAAHPQVAPPPVEGTEIDDTEDALPPDHASPV
jgi:hypothetical protein